MKNILEDIKSCVFICIIIAIFTSWLWVPPLVATLTYGEWSTADGSYKYEAEIIGNIHKEIKKC